MANVIRKGPCPVSDLHFDPKNPRMPSRLHNAEEAEVFKWMLDHGNLLELITSIGQGGYYDAEPLLVTKESGKLIVVEGNRRLSALKLLLSPESAPVKQRSVKEAAECAIHKPLHVPIIEYKSRVDVLEYLGYRHITGVKAWGPLPKAKYIRDLYDNFKEEKGDGIYKFIAEIIGSKPYYVKKVLTVLNSFAVVEDNSFFGIPGIDEENVEYSVFATAFNYEQIWRYIGLDSGTDTTLEGLNPDKLKDLVEWMYKENDEGFTRLGDSRRLKALACVVDTPAALEKFKDGTPLMEAVLITGLPDEDFDRYILGAYDQLKNANGIGYRIQIARPAWNDILQDINSLAKTIRASVQQKLIEQED